MCFGRTACIFAVLILLPLIQFCIGSTIPLTKETNTTSQLDVIQRCRQKCFSKILNEFHLNAILRQYLKCKNFPNCYMCWDYCRAIRVAQKDLARAMCSDSKFCTKGCKVACNFHRIRMIYDIINELSSNEM